MLLRIILKVILLPVRLVIFVFAGTTKFIINSAIINIILYLTSGILFLGFLALAWSAIFVSRDMPLVTRILIPSLALFASYIVSPTSGALKYLELLIKQIEDFNKFLKRNLTRK